MSAIARRAHVGRQVRGNEFVRDAVLGMADGLTVPFALAAGLAGAAVGTSVVLIAGLAEIVAGSIAMGLGGYLAARSDAEHYTREFARERREVVEVPDREETEVVHILRRYGATPNEARSFVRALERSPERWVEFMMRFELGLSEPHPSRARVSALTISLAYLVGGIVPLGPYVVSSDVGSGLVASAIVTAVALLVFGYAKGRAIGAPPIRSAMQTALIGGLAATAAFMLARFIA